MLFPGSWQPPSRRRCRLHTDFPVEREHAVRPLRTKVLLRGLAVLRSVTMRFPAVVLAPWPQPNVMFSMAGEYLVDAVGNVRENSHKMGVWQVFSEWQHLVSIACDYRSRARVSRASGREPGVNPIRHWGDRDCGNFAAWLGVAFSASRRRRWLVRPISIQSTPCRGFLPSFQVPTAFAVCHMRPSFSKGRFERIGSYWYLFSSRIARKAPDT